MKYKKIGDVCTILSGYAFDSKQFSNEPQDVPLIRIRDIIRGRTVTYTKEKFDEKYIVKRGDLLIGMDGEFNIAPWNSRDALLNQRVCKIWCSSEEIEDKYLFYFLPKALKEIESKTSFVTVKHLSVKSINQIEIPLPPIEIQQKIAKKLDTAAALLKLRKQQLAELDQLIQSVFYELFGDPVRNEKGWDSIELNKLAEIVSGITKGRKIKEQELFTIPYMRVANVKDGHIDLTEIKTIEATRPEIERYSLKDKDILMTEGGDPDKLGRGAIWLADIKDCIHQNHIFRVRVEQEKIDPQYFAEYLKLPNAKQYFLRCAKQTTGIASINMKQLKLLPVLLPPIKMQTKFAAIVQKIEQQKALVKQSIDETQTFFDSLMSRYFD